MLLGNLFQSVTITTVVVIYYISFPNIFTKQYHNLYVYMTVIYKPDQIILVIAINTIIFLFTTNEGNMVTV
jgi:hypothetical protein